MNENFNPTLGGQSDFDCESKYVYDTFRSQYAVIWRDRDLGLCHMTDDEVKNFVRNRYIRLRDVHDCNPIAEYIKSIEWDGKPRVATVFKDFLGAKDTYYNEQCSKMFFENLVTAIFNGGYHYFILVLRTQEMYKPNEESDAENIAFKELLARLNGICEANLYSRYSRWNSIGSCAAPTLSSRELSSYYKTLTLSKLNKYRNNLILYAPCNDASNKKYLSNIKHFSERNKMTYVKPGKPMFGPFSNYIDYTPHVIPVMHCKTPAAGEVDPLSDRIQFMTIDIPHTSNGLHLSFNLRKNMTSEYVDQLYAEAYHYYTKGVRIDIPSKKDFAD